MTTTFDTAQIVAQHNNDLLADATRYRQARAPHVPHRNHSARRMVAQTRSAFQTFYAAGQL